MDDLTKLAHKYGTDKGITHSYTPFYYELLKDKRNSIKKVLEMGIGDMRYRNRLSKDDRVGTLELGASLKMWRDFFPNAQIFGADIALDAMFEDVRIKTFVCDETNAREIKVLIKRLGKIDLFIDDASHRKEHQIFLARTILPLLKRNVIYIIEDVDSPREIMRALKEYKCVQPKIDEVPHNHKLKNRLLLVTNK